jgi:hypothetical protein
LDPRAHASKRALVHGPLGKKWLGSARDGEPLIERF